ncbi:MAG: leucine-rich repeat domain-containing protein [Clostridia bacterium]|nr:leucine-rich repeat domain-containing protein [Clostridia bacterium]
MKKRILLTILSFVLIIMSALSFASCNIIPPSWVEGVVYATSEDGTYAEVKGYANTRTYERNGETIRKEYKGRVSEVQIADTYNGLPVRSIKKKAFAGVGIVSVIIPESVTSIGDGAFANCRYLKSIKVAEGNSEYQDIDGTLYTKDGKTLIQYATAKLKTKFIIPESVITISDSAFYGCKWLKSVVIPESVTTIGDSAFYGCKWLKSVIIPESVTSIGDSAFSNSRYLKSITVTRRNRKYKDIDGNLYTRDGKTLIQYAIGKKETKFVVPNGVNSISVKAFYGCDSLTSIVIPFIVSTIGDQAFSNCNKLTGIYYQGIVPGLLDIGSDNPALTSLVYYYKETQPMTMLGQYWHYNENGDPTPW